MRSIALALPIALLAACGSEPTTDHELAHALISQSLRVMSWPGGSDFSNNDRYVSISVADSRADVNFEIVDAKVGGREDEELRPYTRSDKTWINPGLEGSNPGFVNVEAHSEAWPLFFGVRVTLSYEDVETGEVAYGLPINAGSFCVAD